MKKTTIWEILDEIYEQDSRARLKVSNKTFDITIDGFGRPEPVLGNLEEIYKNNKSNTKKTVKELLGIVSDFFKIHEDEKTKKNKVNNDG